MKILLVQNQISDENCENVNIEPAKEDILKEKVQQSGVINESNNVAESIDTNKEVNWNISFSDTYNCSKNVQLDSKISELSSMILNTHAIMPFAHSYCWNLIFCVYQYIICQFFMKDKKW